MPLLISTPEDTSTATGRTRSIASPTLAVRSAIATSDGAAVLAEIAGDKKTSSRFPWASVEEVVKMIESLGGETNDHMLEMQIASTHNIDKSVVKAQLKNDALAWLRPSKGKWAIPKQEFDL